MIFDGNAHKLSKLARPYPDRDTATLAPMRSISYPARDGTRIPGYLSTPRGAPTSHLPLIVMPHGGPIARDTWGYFFLRQFLLSRGYAVLQMNFRGSYGYGGDWFFAAHQDWGGLTYDDVVDGARWAVQTGISDPDKVCIVGWSFGGYIALLGAQRNPELFHCAVDIAGVSDLGLLIDEGHHWLNGGSTSQETTRRRSGQVEARFAALACRGLQGSAAHAARTNGRAGAVRAIRGHGQALKHAHVAHRFTVVPGADHSFTRRQGPGDAAEGDRGLPARTPAGSRAVGALRRPTNHRMVRWSTL